MGYNMGYGGAMMAWNPLLWILIVIAVVLLIVWLGKLRTKDTGSSEETALEILKKRYARGEISSEEFDRMKRDLS